MEREKAAIDRARVRARAVTELVRRACADCGSAKAELVRAWAALDRARDEYDAWAELDRALEVGLAAFSQPSGRIGGHA